MNNRSDPFKKELSDVGHTLHQVVVCELGSPTQDLPAIFQTLANRLEQMEARIEGLELALRTLHTGTVEQWRKT